MPLNLADRNILVWAGMNIKRAKKAGYPDTRFGANTNTIVKFITDIETFRDSASANPASRPVFDALVDSIRALAATDVLTDGLTAAFTTLGTVTVLANTDFLYFVTNNADYPTGTGYDKTVDDCTVFQPAA